MGKRLSHQAEVEQRHIQNGSWDPDGNYYSPAYDQYTCKKIIMPKLNSDDLRGQKVKARLVDNLIKDTPAWD